MPELPEVETIVSGLRTKIAGKKIKQIEIRDNKVIATKKDDFLEQVLGKIVKSISRRAKIVVIELAEEKFLLIHLKLTGQLVYQPHHGAIIAGGHPIKYIGKALPNKFTRAIFVFDDQSKLYFNDVRRFGWIKLVDKINLEKIKADFGIEPLSKGFTLEKFQEILAHKKNTTIKTCLMEQKYLAGLGNIYSDEALFAARIKPTRIVKTLSENEIKKLWQAIPRILKYSIKHRGTSFADYVDVEGEVGNFIRYLKVYGRAGEKCYGCSGMIKKIKIGGRGSHFCEKCQR